MLENPDFEQNNYSKTSTDVYRIGHDIIRLMKWIWYYDRSFHEIINYYDMMGSVLKFLNDVSWWRILRRSWGS